MGLPGLTDRAPLDHASAMNQEHLSAVLATANVQPDKDGWATLEGDRTLTLYVANQGVSLNISRIEALRSEGPLLFARNQRGETFVLALADVFAAAVEGAKSAARLAGFGAR
jgi:hypothetical protein